MPEPAVLSVITVVLNAKRDFAQTLASVRAQTYPHIEYIVVDGVSKDGTLAVIQENQDAISTWISEKDQGFYDAMNKGLRLATGSHVVFMNAGDEFYDPETVARIFAAAPDDVPPAAVGVYYGDTVLTDEDFNVLGPRSHKKLPERLSWKSFRYGSVVCHQAFIARRDIAPEYDLAFPGSSDIEWSIRVLKRAETIVRVPGNIARYKMGGLSLQNKWRYMRERFWIGVRHFGLLRTVWDNLWMVGGYLRRGRVM